MDPHSGIMGPHLLQGFNKTILSQHGGDGSHAQRSGFPFSGRPDTVTGFFHGDQQIFHFREEDSSGRSQFNIPFIGTRKKPGIHTLFQSPDPAAQLGLGNLQPFGGFGKMQFLSHGKKTD